MNTESSLERYDELLLLARDARQRRRWTSWATTGLIVSGIGLNFAYVYSTSQQLRNAEQQAQSRQERIIELERERDLFKAEAQMYRQQGDALVNIAPTLDLGSKLARLSAVLLQREEPVEPVIPTETQWVYDLVWLVEGSRRIPMTVEDVLWIPEAGARIRVRSIENVTANSSNVTIGIFPERRGAINETPTAIVMLPHTIPVVSTVDFGATNCVVITSLGESTRSGFVDGRYVDIDILFDSRPAGTC